MGPRGDIRIGIERYGSVGVLRIAGELDLATVDTAQQGFERVCELSSAAIVDLEDVTFIDSSAINWLFTMREHRLRCLVVQISKQAPASRALELIGFFHLVPRADDRNAALRATAEPNGSPATAAARPAARGR